jgi:hypothetical protein
MTNPNPSGWADPTFGNATSNPSDASQTESAGQIPAPGQTPAPGETPAEPAPGPGQLPTPGELPAPGQLPSIGEAPSVGQSPTSGAVYSPAPPVFGHASVPTPEPAPQWVTNDGTYPGYAVPGYGAPGYGAPYGYGQPMMIAKPTNGMAVAAMVVSIVGIAGLCAYGVGGLIGIVGAILGHVARRQIRERGEQGDGMALAGIIVGWIATGLGVLALGLIIIFVVALGSTS